MLSQDGVPCRAHGHGKLRRLDKKSTRSWKAETFGTCMYVAAVVSDGISAVRLARVRHRVPAVASDSRAFWC